MDYGVVVGIAQYPGFAASGLERLDGPDNDAQAMHDWLVDPDGGKLDPANVTLIRSAQFDPVDPGDPRPSQAAVEAALRQIEGRTRDANGNRLYLYFSGHGFAPTLEEGALFTADASQTFPLYVYAHSWLKAFRRAGLFREFVLWMDCCMNYQQSIVVNQADMRISLATKPLGPAFVGLAAQTKSALEHTMADGQAHGVFTWTLLKGLQGGASDERGRVTGESLRTFLHNAMPEFLPDEVKRAAAVDLHPYVRADEGIVFSRLPARPKHEVRLRIPSAAAGQRLRLWTGRPHVAAVATELTGTEWTGELVRGLYVAEVPDANLRQGFQVSGSGDVEVTVTQSGPPVMVPSDWSQLFSLDVVVDNPAAAITVTDYRFERVFTETGALGDRDAPGVYKIRVQFGRDIATTSEQVLLLDRDLVGADQVAVAAPPLPSSAPIPGSALTNESHEASFNAAADRDGVFQPAAGGPAISIMARYWTDPAAPPAGQLPHPMEGLQLLGPAGYQATFRPEDCQVDDRADRGPVAIWQREVAPGVYFLRQSLQDGRQFEGTLVAVPGRVTQVVIQRSSLAPADGRVGAIPVDEPAVFMRAAADGQSLPEQDAVVEAARLALAQGRNLFGEGQGSQLQDLLLVKYADPIAGIVGCHLLLLAMDADRTVDPARARLFDTAVGNLRGLVGPDHPDVAALALRSTDPALWAARPFTAPPMFVRSWQLMTDASYERPELIPEELWKRVHASISLGPFLVWAVDEQSRALHAEQLSRWIKTYSEPGSAAGQGPLPDAAREAARQAHIPAAAAAELWRG